MSTLNRWLVTACLVVLAAASVAAEGPSLGIELSTDEVGAVDITVMPDGEGLPEGSGNAGSGKEIFVANCVACHGKEGAGGPNDVLVGGHGTLTSQRPQKTIGSYWPYATTLLDYIRRAMPYQTPGSLSNDELYGVTAYLLYLNDLVDDDMVLDAESLPKIQMPNRDNWAQVPDWFPGQPRLQGYPY